MSTGGGNLKGPPPERLAPHLGQLTRRLAFQALDGDRLPGLPIEYYSESFRQRPYRPDIGAIHPDGLGRAIGSQHGRKTRPLRHETRPKPTPGRPNRPIKSQLPQRDDARRLGRDQTGRHQNTNGNWQVVGGADLRKIGRSKIDDHPSMWEPET